MEWLLSLRSLGETETYHIGADRHGYYIVTDKRQKFYIDLEANQQLEREIEAFDREQEIRVSLPK